MRPAFLMPLILCGCASKGWVDTRLAEERAATEAAIQAEREERIAADRALRDDLMVVYEQLGALEDEFDAQLAAFDDAIRFAAPVHFAFDDARVRPEDEPVLARFAAVVSDAYPAALVTVEGFTDPAGPADYNRWLASRRADAVRERLVAHGLPGGQVRAVGYGEERPVAPGAWGDAPGAEANRRVVFVIEGPASPPQRRASRRTRRAGSGA